MADTFNLQITTPERQFLDAAVTRAEIPGKDGYLGILPSHAPLLSELGAGVLTYAGDGEEHALLVTGGFLEVLNDEVRVLAERAEFIREINLTQARQELAQAQEAASNRNSDVSTDLLQSRLRAAQARVDAAEQPR
jgi:F-type H+-transporting ATPase subunit epsilon